MAHHVTIKPAIIAVTFIITFTVGLLTDAAHAADTRIKGYTRKDGSYVAPHSRTAPNKNPYNNYSTKGNSNPYTGQKGYVDPYKSHNGTNRSNRIR